MWSAYWNLGFECAGSEQEGKGTWRKQVQKCTVYQRTDWTGGWKAYWFDAEWETS